MQWILVPETTKINTGCFLDFWKDQHNPGNLWPKTVELIESWYHLGFRMYSIHPWSVTVTSNLKQATTSSGSLMFHVNHRLSQPSDFSKNLTTSTAGQRLNTKNGFTGVADVIPPDYLDQEIRAVQPCMKVGPQTMIISEKTTRVGKNEIQPLSNFHERRVWWIVMSHFGSLWDSFVLVWEFGQGIKKVARWTTFRRNHYVFQCTRYPSAKPVKCILTVVS